MKKSIAILLTALIMLLLLTGCAGFGSIETKILGTWYIDLEKTGINDSYRLDSKLTDGVTFLSDGSFYGSLVNVIIFNSEKEKYSAWPVYGDEWHYLKKEKAISVGNSWEGYDVFKISISGDKMKTTWIKSDQQTMESEYPKDIYWVREQKEPSKPKQETSLLGEWELTHVKISPGFLEHMSSNMQDAKPGFDSVFQEFLNIEEQGLFSLEKLKNFLNRYAGEYAIDFYEISGYIPPPMTATFRNDNMVEFESDSDTEIYPYDVSGSDIIIDMDYVELTAAIDGNQLFLLMGHDAPFSAFVFEKI